MAVFLLIRHGENDWVKNGKLAGRTPGVHLNEKGQAQAQRLAEELAEMPIKVVYSSPLERAVETAEPIARVKGLEVRIHPDLNEIDFGRWTGKDLKDLRQGRQWKIVQGRPVSFRFPGGERFTEAQTRIVDALMELSGEYTEKDVVVCTAHSDLIRLAVAHFLGMALDHFQRIRIAPASVTVLYLNGGQAYFGPINLTFEPIKFSG
jgi:probable phosphoglycerate mutase